MSYWKNALCTHVQGGRGGAPESEHVRTDGDRGSKKRCLSAYVLYGCSQSGFLGPGVKTGLMPIPLKLMI